MSKHDVSSVTRLFAGFCALISSSLVAVTGAQAQPWRDGHAKAVAQYRAGDVASALAEIERAIADAGAERVVRFDAVVIAHAAHNPAKAMQWAASIQLGDAPDYVLRAIGRAARDTGAFGRARAAYDTILARSPGDADAVVGKTLSLLGERNPDAALTTINGIALPTQRTAAFAVWEARALVAEAFGREVDVLRAANEMLALEPGSPAALRLRFASAMRLGLPQMAQTVTPNAVLSKEDRERVTRDALISGGRYQSPGETQSQYWFRLDSLIENLAAFAEVMKGAPDGERALWDLVTLTLDRGDQKRALALLTPLLTPAATFPAWFESVVAQVLLANRKPAESLPWFERAIKGGANQTSTMSAYFYALLEAERVDDALDLSKSMLAEAEAALKAGTGEPADVQALRLQWVRALLYSDQLSPGWEALEPLYARAPANVEINRVRAEALSFRGRLIDAHEQATWLLGAQPGESGLLAQLAGIELQRGDRGAARVALDAARVADPEARAGLRAARDRALNDAPLLRLDVGFAKSRAEADANTDATALKPSINANQERRAELTVYSPWLSDQWRAVGSGYVLRDVDAGGAAIERRGGALGLEWSGLDRSLLAQLFSDGNTTNRTVGLGLRGAINLSDDWRIGASVGRNDLQLPLRARNAGIDMSHGSINAQFRLSDAHRFSANIGVAQFSDSNFRQEISLAWDARWFTHAHWRANTRLDAYAIRHRSADTPYFSPISRHGLIGGATLDWVQWRHYNRSVTHQVAATVGYDWQRGFSPTEVLGLRYAQIWRLDLCTEFRLGAEVLRRGYDGREETKRGVSGSLEHRLL